MSEMTNEDENPEREGPTPEELAKYKSALPRLAWLYEKKYGQLPPEFYKNEGGEK
jgi:hypothetical protein